MEIFQARIGSEETTTAHDLIQVFDSIVQGNLDEVKQLVSEDEDLLNLLGRHINI